VAANKVKNKFFARFFEENMKTMPIEVTKTTKP
jgi:hypothetical protein